MTEQSPASHYVSPLSFREYVRYFFTGLESASHAITELQSQGWQVMQTKNCDTYVDVIFERDWKPE